MKTISICNQKGGVGKTTTAVNLAAALIKHGLRVLCIDLDPQGNLSRYLGHQRGISTTIGALMQTAAGGEAVDPEPAICISSEGIKYIASDMRLSALELFLSQVMFREKILARVLEASIFGEYDYILIDCLPSLGLLLTNALFASDSLIITVQAQPFALDGLEDLLNVYEMIRQQGNPKLTVEGVLVTMADNTVAAREVEKELRNRMGKLVYKTSISRLVEAVDSTAQQCSLINTSGSRIGAQYAEVASELLDKH